MTSLNESRKLWLEERPAFERFGSYLRDALQLEIRRAGMRADVTSRAKELDSLIKKLIVKPRLTYESLRDKAGVQVIVRYKTEVAPILEIAGRLFDRGKPENTSDRLEPNTFGYLSVHAEVRLRPDDRRGSEFPPGKFFAEMQVRTLAQHLWAEMAHDSVYKHDALLEPLPNELQRSIYILAGVVELADEEFSRIEQQIPAVSEVRVLKELEKHYYTLTVRRSDPGLSLNAIRLLTPLYDRPITQIVDHLNEFFLDRKDTLQDVYDKAEESPDRSVFLFQPEALMIYDLLEADQNAIRSAWSGHFPDDELERMANALGISFD